MTNAASLYGRSTPASWRRPTPTTPRVRSSPPRSPKVDVWVGDSPAKRTRPAQTMGRNTFGEVTEARDPNGAVTVTGFDPLGRPTTVTKPDYTTPAGAKIAATTATHYDSLGRPDTVTD